MALYKCKMCGGNLEISSETVATCEYCGSVQTLPKQQDERLQNLFNRANNLRMKCDFDKARETYEKILEADDADAEAHWGMVLCNYGIEYVDDPATGKKIPTCHRAQFASVLTDADYLAALEHADVQQKSLYETEGTALAALQKDILGIVEKEEPFDVFICYKETDESGKRTQDSVIANDIYHQLTQSGLKVFYAAITLEDKLGRQYEPYIFAALNSAKVMLVVGTKPAYFEAVWVRNEWSRYLALMKNDRNRLLIPCYQGMDAYDLPEEFSHLQAQDMSKIGFINDVVRGIKKVTQADEPKAAPAPQVVVQQAAEAMSANAIALLKRGNMALEDGEWQKADGFFEEVLNQDAECAEAYLGKLMAELHVKKREDLKNQADPFDNRNNYQKTVRFASAELKKELEGYITHINDRNEAERIAEQKRLEEERIAEQKRLEEEQIMKQEQAKENAKRLSPIRQKFHPAQKLIAVGSSHTAGLKADGTVVDVIYDKCSPYIFPRKKSGISTWTDIIAIFAGPSHTVGLKADGTVVAVGWNACGECDVTGWDNIVAIAARGSHTVGLKADGTVVAVGSNEDGQCDVSNWTDIVAITAGYVRTVGLKADGTVAAVGSNEDGQCDVSNWTDIVAIATGDWHTVGLKADGTVVAVGRNKYGQCNVTGWDNIVAIAAGRSHTVGLKADGTVAAVGSNEDGQCDVSNWTDIVAIATGDWHTVCLKADGTVMDVGENEDKNYDIAKWKLFENFEHIEEERIAAEERAEKRRIAAEKRAEEERKRIAQRKAELEQEFSTLCTELSNLKGLFTGKRRKELESRIAQIEAELKTL